MALLLIFSFISGFVTILAPCIWPLLPIVLGSSIKGGRSKSLGVTLGIVLSFAILTLSLSYLVTFFSFDPNLLRLLAVVVLLFLGLSLLWPRLTAVLETYLSRVNSRFSFRNQGSGFKPGFLTGLCLGLVWSPCAGPILATIAALAATKAINDQIVLVTFAYAVGLTIPLFFFSYAGGALIRKSRFLNRYTGIVQQAFGLIIILTALSIYTNYDKVLQTKLLDFFPSYSNFLYSLENQKTVQDELLKLRGEKNPDANIKVGDSFNPVRDMKEENLLSYFGRAPEFVGINHWLNTPSTSSGQASSLKLSDLRGKVVLVDFWTYTCINCIRTLPHVTGWYEKYSAQGGSTSGGKDHGLVVVGVHTPEFEFEKKTENVVGALKQYQIKYPVAQDNDYQTWNAYANRYWPAKYLIDHEGKVRYVHFGEGNYEQTEKAIRALLKEAGYGVSGNVSSNVMETTSAGSRLTPETYLGAGRMQFYFPSGSLPTGTAELKAETRPPAGSFSLGGKWMIGKEYSQAQPEAVLLEHFNANKVFLVLRSSGATGHLVKVYLDNQLVGPESSGEDVIGGVLNVGEDRLYNIIDLRGSTGDHLLRLEFPDGGVEVYAFTFG